MKLIYMILILNLCRNTKHQISKRCSEKKHLDVTSLLKLELLEETKKILRIMASRPECEGFAVCQETI